MERSIEEKLSIGGSMTALVTPFDQGEVDWCSLDRLIDRQVEAETDWLVALGTTGETPTLSSEEKEKIVARVMGKASDRCGVMVGTGSNNTAEAVRQTRWVCSIGADAALIVTPSYNKPTQEGVYRHYAAIAEAVELPIVLYHVPSRTGGQLDVSTIQRLNRAFPHIKAVKDATGRVDHLTQMQRSSDISLLCGDDVLTWPSMALGALGVISVLGNLCPALMKALVVAARSMNMDQARELHQKVDDLAGGIGRWGPNPLPIKTAMAMAGLLKDEYRLPLCPLDKDVQDEIQSVMRRHELLETVAV